MRLAQTIAKAMVILAVIAVTLGGAVALGSTLFDSPPRNAAEFAAQVEAGSTHAAPAVRRTAAERSYVLALSDLCADRAERLRDLERRVKEGDELGRLRGQRAILAAYAEDFVALAPPRRFRADAREAAALDQGMLDLADGALAARRAGDRETYEAKLRAAELLRARYNRAMAELDAPACTAAA
jgi:hypothetical protein